MAFFSGNATEKPKGPENLYSTKGIRQESVPLDVMFLFFPLPRVWRISACVPVVAGLGVLRPKGRWLDLLTKPKPTLTQPKSTPDPETQSGVPMAQKTPYSHHPRFHKVDQEFLDSAQTSGSTATMCLGFWMFDWIEMS